MKPIFIGGCERSGTTLLGAMLGTHPRYLCVPEMKFKIDVLSSSGEESATGRERQLPREKKAGGVANFGISKSASHQV
jgi:hypothetical protein